jgi:hypothetical protein
MQFRTDAETTLHAWQDVRHRALLAWHLKPAVDWSKWVAAGISLSLAHDLSGPRTTEFTQARPWIRTTWLLGPGFKLGIRGFGDLPVSAREWKVDSFRGGIGLAPQLGVDFGPLGMSGLRAGFELSATRRFYEYTTSVFGKPNQPWLLSQRLEAGYAFWDFLSLSLEFAHLDGWTAQGNHQGRFFFGQELEIEFSEHFSLALGHSNTGSVMKRDGRSNVTVFNEHSSTVYVSWIVRFGTDSSL